MKDAYVNVDPEGLASDVSGQSETSGASSEFKSSRGVILREVRLITVRGGGDYWDWQ